MLNNLVFQDLFNILDGVKMLPSDKAPNVDRSTKNELYQMVITT